MPAMASAECPRFVDGRDLSEEQKGVLDAFKTASDEFRAQYRELVARARDLAVAGVDPQPLMGDAMLGDDLYESQVHAWLAARRARRDEQAYHRAFGRLSEEVTTALAGLDESQKKSVCDVLQVALHGREMEGGAEQAWKRPVYAKARQSLSENTVTLLMSLSDTEKRDVQVALRLEPSEFRAQPGGPSWLGTKVAEEEDIELEHAKTRFERRGPYLLPSAEYEARSAALEQRIKAERRARRHKPAAA
jgi:hypothetical protein